MVFDDIYFVNLRHRTNFQELCNRVSRTRYKDYRTAAYILSLPDLYQKALPYFSDEGFNSAEMFQQDFSSGFKILLELAVELFGGRDCNFDLNYAISTLDDSNFRVMLQAISIRRF